MGRKRIEDKFPEILPLLGTMTDKELAKKYNCVPHTIFGARKRHGVAACGVAEGEDGAIKNSVLPFPSAAKKEAKEKGFMETPTSDTTISLLEGVLEDLDKMAPTVADSVAAASPVKNIERDSERRTILRKGPKKEGVVVESATTANRVFLMTSKVMENGSSAVKCYPFQSLNGIKVFGEGDPRIEELTSFNTIERAQEHLKNSGVAGACKVSVRSGVREWGRSAFDWPTDEEDAYTLARRKVQKAVEKGSDVSLSAIEVKSLFGRMVL